MVVTANCENHMLSQIPRISAGRARRAMAPVYTFLAPCQPTLAPRNIQLATGPAGAKANQAAKD